jgi:hypothetical protein
MNARCLAQLIIVNVDRCGEWHDEGEQMKYSLLTKLSRRSNTE